MPPLLISAPANIKNGMAASVKLSTEENIFCNVISASTQKLSEEVYGSMMLGIPSSQFDKAVSFIHNVANVEVEEVE